MNRRTFLKRTAAAAVAGSTGTLAYAMLLEPHWLQIVHRDLPIADLPDALVGKTLAQVSDIHVGPQVSDDYLMASFDRVGRLHPDIVTFTGDFVSYRVDRGDGLVLSHNPDAMDVLDWGDHRGWVLAGHTHGGQCKAPFLPPPLLPVENKRYVSGEVPVDGGRTLYISRGVGHLLRARFNVRPEITMFTLRKSR